MIATHDPPAADGRADAPDALTPRQPPPPQPDEPAEAAPPDARVWAEVAAELAE
jgi:hypothetical protein